MPSIISSRHVAAVIVLLAGLFLAGDVAGLIFVQKGNDPVDDKGWPRGAVAVANLKSRVLLWEGPPFGGGQYNFEYQGDSAALQKALDAFAKIRAPKLELILLDGPHHSHFLKDEKDPTADIHVDFTFTVWRPESWHRLYNDPTSRFGASQPQFRQPVDPPRMTVYVGGGLVDWSKVKVPKGLEVIDRRASAQGVDVSDGTVIAADVYDMTTHKPITNATLHVVSRGGDADAKPLVAKADDDGRVVVEKIPAGSHHIRLQAPGYAPRTIGYEQFQAPTYQNFTAYLIGTTTVAGKVVDESGKPIEGATVRLRDALGIDGRGYSTPETLDATTNAAGEFQIDGAPIGYTRVFANHDSHTLGLHNEVYKTPARDITLAMQATGSLKVSVVDQAGNAIEQFDDKPIHVDMEPEGGSKVGSYGGGGKVQTGGVFTYRQLPPGVYVIQAYPNPRKSDHQYVEPQTVKIEAGKQAEVTVRFK